MHTQTQTHTDTHTHTHTHSVTHTYAHTQRIERRVEIIVLQAYRDVVAERMHIRKVLKSLITMWIDKGRRHVFSNVSFPYHYYILKSPF